MLQLKNKTPFSATMALFPNESGVDTLYVMVKASFDIGPKWTLCDEQIPPVESDVYWQEPESSSLQYASDYHVGKPSTDIIMNGLACATDRQNVRELDVHLEVGRVSKAVKVYGDRRWNNGKATSPEPFQTMPMIYEKAYGGMHLIDGEIDSAEARNPLGLGHSGTRSTTDMNGIFLPNLEDPRNLIDSHSDTPQPACFGFCSPAWQPRAGFAGSYDEAWKSSRAPYLPRDFDTRFLNMAHPDLIYPGYLQGGESVSISGMHPRGVLNFELPKIELISKIYMNGESHTIRFKFETLLLEPNLLQLSQVWRAAYSCDKKAQHIEKIEVNLKH